MLGCPCLLEELVCDKDRALARLRLLTAHLFSSASAASQPSLPQTRSQEEKETQGLKFISLVKDLECVGLTGVNRFYIQ